MGAVRWLELDRNDNISIVAATVVGSYTCNADRAVYATLYAQGLAGNGDYVYHVTVTPSGLSEAEALKTTQTLGATTYVLWGQTIPITIRNGDVMKVYLKGLAGDGATPDTRVNFFEDAALQPTTADRTLDVDANGGAEVGSFQAGAITAAALATGAIDADALATDAVNEIVDQVWNEVIADHVTAGSTGKKLTDASAAGDPWAAATRTLTQTAAAVTAAVSGATVTIQRGDTLSATITGLAANTSYVSIDFTVKASPDDTDDGAILRIRKNASTTNDGLLRLNGAALVAPVVAADGSITVNSATSITIALAARATDDLLDADGLFYDIQAVFATTVQTLTAGTCNITADITRAVS
jgi:hypothetical protein